MNRFCRRNAARALVLGSLLVALPSARAEDLVVDTSLGNSPYTIDSQSIAYENELVGLQTTGQISQLGAENRVSTLILGGTDGTFGHYALFGGTLHVSGNIARGGTGNSRLDIAGGTLIVDGRGIVVQSLLIGRNGFEGSYVVPAGQTVAVEECRDLESRGRTGRCHHDHRSRPRPAERQRRDHRRRRAVRRRLHE